MGKDNPVLRDRGYYRLLTDRELFALAEQENNELAIVLAERRTGRRSSTDRGYFY